MLAIVDEKLIILSSSAKSKDEIFESLATLLHDNKRITDVESFVIDLWKREEQGSTGFENNIAIPHAKSKQVLVPSVVFFRTKDGVEFSSLDGSLAKLVFLIAVPEGRNNLHLEILAKIAKLMMNTQVRDCFMTSDSKSEILSLLSAAINK